MLSQQNNVIRLLALIFSPMGLSSDRGVVYWAATLPQLWAWIFLSHATAGTNNSLKARNRCVNYNLLPAINNTLDKYTTHQQITKQLSALHFIFRLKFFLCQLKTNLYYFNFFGTEALIKYLHSDRRDKWCLRFSELSGVEIVGEHWSVIVDI